ncbi:hypothetical protein D3C75_893220 [compost metagenome]
MLQLFQVSPAGLALLFGCVLPFNQCLQLRHHRPHRVLHHINLPLQLQSEEVPECLKKVRLRRVQLLPVPLLLKLRYHPGGDQRTDAIAHIALAHIHNLLHFLKGHRLVLKEHDPVELSEGIVRPV